MFCVVVIFERRLTAAKRAREQSDGDESREEHGQPVGGHARVAESHERIGRNPHAEGYGGLNSTDSGRLATSAEDGL